MHAQHTRTYRRGDRPRIRRAAATLAISALALAIALGGCHAGAARDTGGGAPVSQGATTTTSGASGTASNAALQRLQGIDAQNQVDQQQLSGAQQNAGVDYPAQDTTIQP